jgi:peptide/nickel transport system permease protein
MNSTAARVQKAGAFVVRLAKYNRTLLLSSCVFGTVFMLLLLTSWIAPHDPSAMTLSDRFSGPSAEHWLGLDHLGRDILSRLLYGGQFSVSIAAITLALSALIGTVLGAISARVGGALDEFIMRIVDLMISFPDVLVALFLVAILGPGYGTMILALVITGWTPFARMTRGLALEINAKDYIRAAEILGCSRTYIILHHVIPNILRPLATIAFLRFGHKLITVGSLSFLGLGVQPPDTDWGAMLAEALPYLDRAPSLVLIPGLAIFVTALSITLIGQGLEAHMDDKMKWRHDGK